MIMNKIFLTVLAIVSLYFNSFSEIPTISTIDDSQSNIVMKVGSEQVFLNDFTAILNKNNNNKEITREYLDEYANLFVDFKRKVLYAEEMKLDTSASFIKELAGYRKQLARPYLTDKAAEEDLIIEAYDRLKYELNVSHILITIDSENPDDTLVAFNKINALRSQVLSGEDFGKVAQLNSDDPSAKSNKGNLGYFTAFRMLYDFENKAYNTEVGKVSTSFKTQYGYHILKVNDKRLNRGEVKVSHIMLEEREDATPQEIEANKMQIKELKEAFESGTSFDEMVKFSDDKESKKKNGELPWFSSGRMVPEFEEMAFSLKEVGEISEPVKTSYGWHFIKLIDTKPIKTFEESKAEIQQKIKRDSRSSKGRTALIKRIKEEYGFKQHNSDRKYNDFYTAPLNQIDMSKVTITSALKPFYNIDLNNWKRSEFKSANKTLFTLANTAYTQKDFADYLATLKFFQKVDDVRAEINKRYSQWVNQTCVDYEDSRLEEKYPEFKAIMDEYHDGIMLFDLMDMKVWSKAVEDTVGLQSYYELTKENYNWGESVEVDLFTCANQDVANRLRTMLNNRYSSRALTQKELELVNFGKGGVYLSNEKISLILNLENPNNLRISKKVFSKGESDAIDKKWKPGLTADEIQSDNSVKIYNLIDFKNGKQKSFEEARGLVITDYQNFLESVWMKELEKKYPAEIYYDVLYSILKK